MSPRPRRQLLAFALATAAAAFAATVPLAALATSAGDTRSASAIVIGHPENRAPQETTSAPSDGERAAEIALQAVGVPYRWGGSSPSSGFDCSGLVRWAYGRIGIDLPHNSYALYGEGRRVPQRGMKAGDVLFFEGLGHVGLYLGKGRMVHAPYSGKLVEVVRLNGSNYGRRLIGARRVASA